MRPDEPNKDGRTALHFAAEAGHVEIAHAILNASSPVILDLADREGIVPLHIAVRSSSSVTELLLDHGASMTRSDAQGKMVLHHVAEGRLDKLAELLLGRRADVQVLDH